MYTLQIFHYDFGIFAKIIWQLSRFQLPNINHRVLGDIFFLGDHFNPSLVILAPLFWLTSNIKILLFEQALATTLSGLMIFLIARKLKFAFFPSLIFSFVFLLFAGTENPLVTDWHPESTAGFFLLLFFYLFNFTSYKKLSYLSALIFLGFKESNALTFIFLLIWIFLMKKVKISVLSDLGGAQQSEHAHGVEKRGIELFKNNEIIVLVIFSLIYFFVTTKIFIPFFSHQSYMYSPDLPKAPIQYISNYFNHPLKTKLIFDSLISFGFLPIFSVVGLIPIFLELGVRLIPNNSIFQNFALTFHYNVYLGIFLALATIYGVKNILTLLSFRTNPDVTSGEVRNLVKRKTSASWRTRFLANARNDTYKLTLPIIIGYLFIFSLYAARKITNSPINFAVSNIFWQELKPRNDIFDDLKSVPNKGSVMSQNNLLPFFVQRKDKLMFLKEDYANYKPEIIVIDLTPGQNPNNFWDSNFEIAIKIKDKLLKDKSYKQLQTQNKNLFIFTQVR